MNKKELTERDICSMFIRPAMVEAGWNEPFHIREEVNITNGRVIVRGNLTTRAKNKRADFVLYHKSGQPIAVIEAKDNKHSVTDGMQQALDYASMLEVPFVFSSNGDGFAFQDRSGTSSSLERIISLSAFPTPQKLWEKYRQWRGLDDEQSELYTQDYYEDGSDKQPRYYQSLAINKTIEAIAKGQDRILLVMATGTGKTYTAFQIIWRLWKSRRAKRILYLADRNVLIDQTMVNDFKPFKQVMAKLTTRNKVIEKKEAIEVETAIDKNDKTVNKSYEIYLSLYQAIVGREGEEGVYKQFSPDFFDLIVVDECHRGSAAEDSAWREILEYFSSAIQVGLTATPKETKYVSNIHYFGSPVYTYSLKQGIEDGFLAPYKVIRIDFDKDYIGWRPPRGKKDKYGQEIEDRIYNQIDFDRGLIIDDRTQKVAYKVSEFLKQSGDRYAKTIVFCEDIDHAERMRHALVNENMDLVLENPNYIMRITGDNEVGKAQLDNFIDPEVRYPVITTTSKLMTTGVDAQTCKLVVLDRRIQSMTEFKQIIGRGTRIKEEYDKLYFTIMDFKQATQLFADPDFDGTPVSIYEPGSNDPPVPPPDNPPTGNPPGDDPPPDTPPGGGGKRTKYYVDDIEVTIIAERVQYYDKDGRLVTETLKDYTKKAIRKNFKSLNEFLRRWNQAEQKSAIIEELTEHGVILEALVDELGDQGKEYGAFDLICHIAFDQPPLTRKERADNVRKRNYFTKYGDTARAVLETLLEKYANGGIQDLEDPAILRVHPFDQMGTAVELIRAFGGREQFEQAIHELENILYDSAG